MLDLRIVNAVIIDGSGSEGYRGAIGVREGRIVLDPGEGDARRTIDAEGRVVSPGFIDVHTHYDAQICWDPTLSPSSYHGVTTVFGGNCGFSVAPLSADAASYLVPMLARVEGMPIKALEQGLACDWSSFADYLARFEGKIAINAGFMAGHSTIRRVVMGERATREEASPAELERMKQLLATAIEQGALGFSTTVSNTHSDADGLPVPSRFASREELMTLAQVCSRYEGTLLELNPGVEFGEEVYDLLTDFSLAGQRPVNWNLLDVSGTTPEAIARTELQMTASDHARARGAEVIALTLPSAPTMRLNLRSGFLLDALAGWDGLFRIPIEERMERLRDPAFRRQLDTSANSPASGALRQFAQWRDYTVVETFAPENKAYEGRTIGEIADEQGKDAFDAMLDIALADRLDTSFMPRVVGADHATFERRARYWKDDRTVVGASDAGAHNDMIDTFAFSTRLLELGVRKHKVISLAEAVHQLTEVPARLYGLRERGLIRDGWHADLVIFDPDTVGCGPVHMRDDFPAGEKRLYAVAEGISHVIVNGEIVIEGGECTGASPGTVIRPGRDTATVAIPAAAKEAA